MHKLVVALLFLCICTGAEASSTEPFGTRLQIVPPAQFIAQQAEVLETNKELILSIAYEVRLIEDRSTWTAWVSQFVNLSKVGDCVPTAVELAVLHQLGFVREDLRLVRGSVDFAVYDHAVAAVHINDQWWILEDRYLIVDYRAVLDSKIRSSFHALEAYQ